MTTNKKKPTMPEKYSLERHFRIYDNATGTYISIGDDREGSNCLEISNANNLIIVTRQEIPLIIQALQEWKEKKETEEKAKGTTA